MNLRSHTGFVATAVTAVSLVSIILLSTTTALSGPVHTLAIYGHDDRIEVYEEQDVARRILATSVVAIVPSNVVTENRDGSATLGGVNYGQDNHLCSTERFTEQSAPADCSGFLVADTIIATAGHCVVAADFCSEARFVFGFAIDKRGRDPQKVKLDDIYGCKKILHQQLDSQGADFALVELDRPVAGRQPLVFAKQTPATGDDLFVIGHPGGLPEKIAGGAKVRTLSAGYFVANLDTFLGSSGSAVFNDKYEVAGIVVRGENDFVSQGGCFVSRRCNDLLCRGEDVTNSDIVSKALIDALRSYPVPPAASRP